MNIDPRNSASHLYAQSLAKQAQPAQAKPAAEMSAAANDKVELNALERLRELPEIRPEVVARGKELLKDPNFPSQEMVSAMAKLIVPFADDE